MGKTYRPYEPEQLFLLPPALQDWVPEGHRVHFISEVVDQLDLRPILVVYEQEARGYPPSHIANNRIRVHCVRMTARVQSP